MLKIKCGAIAWTPQLKTTILQNFNVNCVGCGTGTENLMHFLDECSLYENERKERDKSLGKAKGLKVCMNVTEKMVKLIKFIKEAMEKRRRKITYTQTDTRGRL